MLSLIPSLALLVVLYLVFSLRYYYTQEHLFDPFLQVPLVDYHAEILRRRPTDWDGALEAFAAYEGYEVPTLICRDGVHPSNPAAYSATYSEEALNRNGFSLRNALVLSAYADLIREVLARPAPGNAPARE